jgi:hypothetical protein
MRLMTLIAVLCLAACTQTAPTASDAGEVPEPALADAGPRHPLRAAVPGDLVTITNQVGQTANQAVVDDAGNLHVAGQLAGSVTANNASVAANDAGNPNSSTIIGWIRSDNTVAFVSAANPLPVTGSFTATAANVGVQDAAAPTSGGIVAWIRADGTLVSVSTGNPLPVSGTLTCNAGTGTFTIGGTVTSNIGTTGGLALDTTLTGGTAKCQPYDGTNTIGTAAHPMIVNQGTGGGTNATPYTDFGATISATIASGARTLLSLVTTNRDTANDVYVAIDDTAGLPDGAAPSTYVFPCPKAPTGTISVCGYDQTMRPNGWPVTNGLSFCISTSSKTCTTAGLDAGNSDLMVGYQ